ncbi:hypothetical protein HHK36_009160 [Tetracentron sinense]|uniref:AB hydrolase-1 domain-containing protein n=1 Tax=Tetracentron sinense TaxID=13715 RepID=A0A835DI37_TETSI|nr:hypothetical protein HHK36_009160 [Tetracentron sinense]
MGSMKHFVLVHGACHGAWCWHKLVTLLKLAGHKATALDLGASGINPKRIDEIVSISDYLQPLMEFLASLPQEEKVILAGHSFGGFCVSLAMERFPGNISVAVFVTAFMPSITNQPGPIVQEDLTLATMLVRPTGLFIEELSKESLLSEEKFGSVSRVYVVCDKDEVIKEDYQRWMIDNSPVKEVKLITGADHMPMFSKPQELFLCFIEIAERYA